MKKSELIEWADKLAENYARLSEATLTATGGWPAYTATDWYVAKAADKAAPKPALSAKDKRIAELEAQVAALIGAGEEVVANYLPLWEAENIHLGVEGDPYSVRAWRTLVSEAESD